MRKDSKKPASFATASSFSLGITIIVSTLSSSSCMPRSACGHAPLAFKGERPGDHRNGERAHLAGQRGNHGSRARARASAQSGGHEHHVRAFESFDDLFGIFQRRAAAHVGIRARAQAAGELHAQLQLHRRLRELQRLRDRCWRR